MQNKLLSVADLIQIRKKFKKKKIVLAHGVFDIIHQGHIEYFKEAKKYGEILIVSVTADKFVNKGLNRPYFKAEERMNFLSEIQIVDFVVLSQNKSSIEIIKKLKPNVYVKGPDYVIKKNDKAGNLKDEKKAVETGGGKLKFTTGVQFSSTKIINDNFEGFKKIPDFLKVNNVNNDHKTSILKEFDTTLKKIKNQKILVIGEIIIDNYLYSKPLGTPSKENILSVNFQKKTEFLGGTIPVLNNMSEVCDNITFLSFFKNKNFLKSLKKKISKKVKLNLIQESQYKEIKKSRYIDINNNKKFFEYYDFHNQDYENKNLIKFLKKNLKKFDKVIVCDFGHGLINKKIVNILQNNSKNLCINIQTNSGNRGFNFFTKFEKADLLVLDEPEMRLGLMSRYEELNEILYDKKLSKFKNVMITLGVNGLALKLKNERKYKFFPALSTNVVDTIGAGDAAYSYCSAFINNSKNNILIGLLSSLAGAIKTTILGHSNFIKIADIRRSLENILK